MTPAETTFLVFPAFLIGAALGILVALALAGAARRKASGAPIAMAIGGSAAGVLIYLATPGWWPFIAGPFILTVALALAGAIVASFGKSV